MVDGVQIWSRTQPLVGSMDYMQRSNNGHKYICQAKMK